MRNAEKRNCLQLMTVVGNTVSFFYNCGPTWEVELKLMKTFIFL